MTDKLKMALVPYVEGFDQFEKVIANLYQKHPETESLLFIMVDHLDLFGRINWRLLHGACEHILTQVQAAKNLTQIEENPYQKFIDSAKELSEIHFREAASDEVTIKDLSESIRSGDAGGTLEYWRYLQAEFVYRVVKDLFGQFGKLDAVKEDEPEKLNGYESVWLCYYLINAGCLKGGRTLEDTSNIIAEKIGNKPTYIERILKGINNLDSRLRERNIRIMEKIKPHLSDCPDALQQLDYDYGMAIDRRQSKTGTKKRYP